MSDQPRDWDRAAAIDKAMRGRLAPQERRRDEGPARR
jgi:hypothetical protein